MNEITLNIYVLATYIGALVLMSLTSLYLIFRNAALTNVLVKIRLHLGKADDDNKLLTETLENILNHEEDIFKKSDGRGGLIFTILMARSVLRRLRNAKV